MIVHCLEESYGTSITSDIYINSVISTGIFQFISFPSVFSSGYSLGCVLI